jgi:hypothetical protein
MFHLTSACFPVLPRLAWCARIDASGKRIQVKHGPSVECNDTHCVAGAWNGTYRQQKFADATVFCGTGISVLGDSAVFSTSTNTHDRLFVAEKNGQLSLSNSLAFLLSETAIEIDPQLDITMIWIQFALGGISRVNRHIPTDKGNLRVFECCNLLLDRNGNLERQDKPIHTFPPTYQGYTESLRQVIIAVMENCQDANRKRQYKTKISISRGYDSAGLAGLTSDLDVEAATLYCAEPENLDDEGSRLATQAGIKVSRFASDWRMVKSQFSCLDSLFCVAPPIMERSIAALEPQIENCLRLSGDHGDKLFATDDKQMVPDLIKTKIPQAPADTTTYEYRLWIGCISFPVYYTGWQHYKTLLQISCSDEMKPWSIGGDYDRPIMRRLAEEAGVQRDEIASVKQSAQVSRVGKIDSLHSDSQISINTYLADHGHRFAQTSKKPAKRINRKIARRQLHTKMFHWAINHLQKTYRLAADK